MATKKKEALVEETPMADCQPLQEENQEGTILEDGSAIETASEQGETEASPSDAEAGNTHVTKTPDEADNEPREKPAGLALESLSVLADRHRIPAWHQAALLRYMGWQDDKMVTDEDYRKALDELKHRRIGGGRK